LLQNLIGNALQHGSDKRDVTVTLKGEPDAIRLMVHNHGSPISEDAIATSSTHWCAAPTNNWVSLQPAWDWGCLSSKRWSTLTRDD
jgi:LytS/YehU family sensor histidine kinase